MTSLSEKPVFRATIEQLGIAPENIRAGDDVDDAVEELATALVAGQIVPLLVRKAGNDSLKDWLILDGRRRYLAFDMLFMDGRIDEHHPIDCILCETPEEIAAATVVANTSRLEVSMADYLLAINRLSRKFKTHDEIGRVLGIDAKKVKQLSALGALDIRFLEAFKRRELTLANLRMLTKVKTPGALDKLASRADIGDFRDGNSSYYISSAMDNGASISAESPAALMIGVAAYVEAGGTIDQDLFEETPDKLLDTKLVLKLLLQAVKPATDIAKTHGLTPWVSLMGAGTPPDGAMTLGWPFESSCDRQDLSAARGKADELQKLAQKQIEAGERDAWSDTIKTWIAAEIAWHQVKAAPLETTDCTLYTAAHGLCVQFLVSTEAFEAWRIARKAEEEANSNSAAVEPSRPKVVIPSTETVVETTGYQHVLHGVVTKRAGQALAASLAADPAAAFTAQLAAQFQQCVLTAGEYHYGKPDRLLDITICPAPKATVADETFIRPIVEKLQTYVGQWQESGQHPYAWVHDLDGVTKGDLFALITALQVNTFEDKTNALRPRTRAEAAYLTGFTGHDIRDLWLPDASFYSQFSKKQLLGFLAEMKVKTKEHEKTSRDDLARDVAVFGHTAQFAPAAFDFVLVEPPETQAEDHVDDDITDEVDDQDVDTFDDDEVDA